jgi:hypothetical protein
VGEHSGDGEDVRGNTKGGAGLHSRSQHGPRQNAPGMLLFVSYSQQSCSPCFNLLADVRDGKHQEYSPQEQAASEGSRLASK